MSAASDSRDNKYAPGVIQSVPLDKAIQTIYMGTMVCHDTTGYCVSGADTVGYVLAGVAAEKVQIDVANTSDGDHEIRVWRGGVHRFITAGAAVTDVGKPVWLTDDQTVQLTPGNVFVGTVVRYISATAIDVDITPAVERGTVRKSVQIPLVTLTAASTTYKVGGFIAKRAAQIMGAKVAAVVAPDYATSTLAIDNYDLSGTAARNVLEAANYDLEGLTALQSADLTLSSSTPANLLMAEGDFINATVAIGATEADAGEGIAITLEIEEYGVPNPA